jgi:hypothetical protein
VTIPVYPTLPGLGFTVSWTPGFAVASDQAANLASIDMGLAATPVHQFELTYDLVRDTGATNFSGTSELKTFMGFFLYSKGSAGRFLFENPDDNDVTGQAVGTGDGATTTFGPLQRTFAGATEYVGYVNTGKAFTVYDNGVALTYPTDYTFDQTVYGAQNIVFAAAPVAGHAITIDYHYYYYCRWTDSSLQFEKFMQKLWRIKSAKFQSTRAGS